MTPTSTRSRALTVLSATLGTVLATAVIAAPAHAAAATITGPTTAAAGSQVVLSGGGWPAYASANIYLVRNTTQNFICSLHADSAGAIAAQTCTVPTFLVAASYTIHADDAHGHTADAGSPMTLVPAATLTSTFNSAATFHVAAGSTVGLSGHGFAPGSGITVKLGTTTVATTPASPLTDTNGSFTSVTFTVPANQAVGQLSVKVTDASTNTTTSALQVYRAGITGKATAAAGSPFTISGDGFPGDDPVNVYLGHSGTNNFVCSLHTDDSGVIASQSCAIPTYLAAGAYSLVASDGAVTVSQPFTMTSSLVANSTFNGQQAPAVAAGGTLALVGHGYAATSALTVTIGSKTLTTTPAAAATDASGSFTSVLVTVPANQSTGKQTLTVTDAASDSHTFKLYVFKAKVTAPAAGPAGVSQLLGGSGWPAMDTITAYLHYSSNGFMCTLHSDATGTIAMQSCTVPNYLAAGDYSVLMSDGFVTASKAFTMQSAIAATNASSQPIAGGPPGTAVNLTGWGFTASSTISAKLGTKSLNLVPTTPSTTTSGGFSSVNFAVPTMSAGTYALTVTDASNRKASVQFTVS